MEIQIAWGALLKIFGMGVLTYVLAPALLVLRDKVLWLAIDAFVFTSNVKKELANYCLDKAWIDHAGITPFRITGSEENPRYHLGDREVVPEVFQQQKRVWHEKVEVTSKQEAFLRRRELFLDRILRYYQQDRENPLRQQRERLYQQFTRSFVDRRSTDNLENT